MSIAAKADETTAHATNYVGAFVIGFVYAVIGHDIQGSTSEKCIISYLSNGKCVSVEEALTVVALELLGSPKPVQTYVPMRVSDQFRKIFELEKRWTSELKEEIDVLFASKTLGMSDQGRDDCITIKMSTSRPCAYLPNQWNVVSIKPLKLMEKIIQRVSATPNAMKSLLPMAAQAIEQSGTAAARAQESNSVEVRIEEPDQAGRVYCLAAILLKESGNASRATKDALARICQETTKLRRVAFRAEDDYGGYRTAVGMIRQLSAARTVVYCPVADQRFDSCVACGTPESGAAAGDCVLVRPLVIGIKANALVSNISGNYRIFSFKKTDRKAEGDACISIMSA
jgi:hypothetical protein